MTGEQIYQAAVKALNDKKAEDIQVMKIGDLTIVADYFVIATGTSSTHVKSLADNVEYELGLQGVQPGHIEGKATGWILLDYGSVVVHVFLADMRGYYNLERLWTDAAQVDIQDLISSSKENA
ncbi:MAG TPA: ribosome silencing factor [Candidatus Onthovicinus excrementipullorum]|nr:ribosome silencing factor [Candidatus Onthovicinus excrementipullorum]